MECFSVLPIIYPSWFALYVTNYRVYQIIKLSMALIDLNTSVNLKTFLKYNLNFSLKKEKLNFYHHLNRINKFVISRFKKYLFILDQLIK